METWRIFLPYCIAKLPSGNWIFLNREYAPVGVCSREYIDYEKSEAVFKFTKDPETVLNRNSLNTVESAEGTRYYLFDDGCTPYSSTQSEKDYFLRVKKIMKLRMKYVVSF